MRTFLTCKNKHGKIIKETDITCINSSDEYYKIIQDYDDIQKRFQEEGKKETIEIWLTLITNDGKDIIYEIYVE